MPWFAWLYCVVFLIILIATFWEIAQIRKVTKEIDQILEKRTIE